MSKLIVDGALCDSTLVKIVDNEVVQANNLTEATGILKWHPEKLKWVTIGFDGERITTELVLPAGIRQYGLICIATANKETMV